MIQDKFALERLVNVTGTGGGTNLPPRQFGALRVPIVTNLRILKVDNYFGGTAYTLAWNDPPFPNVRIAQYNIFVSGIDGVNEPQMLVSAIASPSVIRVTTRTVSRLIFFVQTQLINGTTSPLANSPSVSSESVTPIISGGSLGPSGVTAGAYGTASQVGTFTVDAAGLITAASNTQIYLDRLRLPVSTKTSGPYTILATDFLVIGDTTSGSFSILLPATPAAGDTYCVKKSVAANTLTLDGNGKNIDGTASIAITTQYTSYTVIYNGTEWSII
jgi:hypothetical protein